MADRATEEDARMMVLADFLEMEDDERTKDSMIACMLEHEYFPDKNAAEKFLKLLATMGLVSKVSRRDLYIVDEEAFRKWLNKIEKEREPGQK